MTNADPLGYASLGTPGQFTIRSRPISLVRRLIQNGFEGVNPVSPWHLCVQILRRQRSAQRLIACAAPGGQRTFEDGPVRSLTKQAWTRKRGKGVTDEVPLQRLRVDAWIVEEVSRALYTVQMGVLGRRRTLAGQEAPRR
jgi:hypothetical protein